MTIRKAPTCVWCASVQVVKGMVKGTVQDRERESYPPARRCRAVVLRPYCPAEAAAPPTSTFARRRAASPVEAESRAESWAEGWAEAGEAWG